MNGKTALVFVELYTTKSSNEKKIANRSYYSPKEKIKSKDILQKQKQNQFIPLKDRDYVKRDLFLINYDTYTLNTQSS